MVSTNEIGDGKTPNKYWVSISTDMYYQDGNMMNWQSDIIGGKQKSKILKVFPQYVDAKNLAESIVLGKIYSGVIANSVAIEDRLSGQVYFRTYNSREEDLGFSLKREKELGVKSSKMKIPSKSKVINGSNVTDYIISFEEGNISTQDFLLLFSYLIKSGRAWSLQGMYGRQARDLIDSGVISKAGVIDWDKSLDM